MLHTCFFAILVSLIMFITKMLIKYVLVEFILES